MWFANIRENTDHYLRRMADKLTDMEWYEHNAVTLRAKAALEKAGYGA